MAAAGPLSKNDWTADKLTAAALRYNLTPREIQVLWLLAHGETAKGTASLLIPPISQFTVQNHVDKIHLKLGQPNTSACLFFLFGH